MRAMTWWDHETRSVWSQPWGTAIDGPLEGTQLDQIPAEIMPWDAWLNDHPDTLVLSLGDSLLRHMTESFSADFIVGIALGEDAKAYPFEQVSDEGLVNDRVGPFAVLVIANADTKAVHAFLRLVGDEELEFEFRADWLTDVQTGSVWDPARGIAFEGPLRGEVLQRVPYTTAFDWAWQDFYPHTEIYNNPQ